MKKHVFLKILIAIVLLTSMLLTLFLGTTKSEYFKSFSKKLDIEAKPDLMLEYYLYDGSSTGGKGFKEAQGVYKNAESFSQEITVGRNDACEPDSSDNTKHVYRNAEWLNGVTLNSEKYTNAAYHITAADNIKYNGKSIIYQIKFPVDEAGYYVLNFQVDFFLKHTKGWSSETEDFFTQHYNRAIGCEILNHNDGFEFIPDILDEKKKEEALKKPLDLYSRSGNDCVHGESKLSRQKTENSTDGKSYINKKYFEADSLYQWKTLSPSRAENVSLAFKVEPEDVDNGYVLWMWDFSGLFGAKNWKLEFTDISVEKTMELDGSTDNRDGSSDPYFMFPQTSFMNNQIVLSLDDIKNKETYDHPFENLQTGLLNDSVRSVQHSGKTSYSKGRGTFATSATANSLTFQAESLFFGYGTTSSLRDFSAGGYLNEEDNLHEDGGHSNPVSVYIPLKNIEYDTDYKVTFDLSLARQGTYIMRTNDGSGTLAGEGNVDIEETRFYGVNDDAGYGTGLVDYSKDVIFRPGEEFFSSYFLSNKAGNVNRTENLHKKDMGLITYADKHYDGAPLTKYDEINSLTNLNNSIVQSVNNTYCNDIYSTNTSKSRNWFNAVQHTEYNGQNEIHWLTFYNTTFSFNIPEAENGSIDLDDLYWVWVMDSLISGCYYRIKFENVRIEKVVKYSSSLNPNGVKIAGTQISLKDHSVKDPKDGSDGYTDDDKDETTRELNFFRSFRGINGTGQNYQARGFVLDENTAAADKIFTSEGNIYAPIIDATKFKVATGSEAYQIALDGFTVCQGGVAKYVFSVDGGRTWEDMTFTGGKASTVSPDQLTAAEKGVNQHTSGQTRYDETKFSTIGYNIKDYTYVDFTNSDRANANFAEFKLVANLEKYKNQANLDVIIAAVPEKDTDCKCEILRVINFNQIRNYMTFPFDFVSDIEVNGSNGSLSPLNVNRLDEPSAPGEHGTYYDDLVDPEATGFTWAKTWCLVTETNAQGKTTALMGPSSTTGYARMASHSYAYEDIRALYSDFPVKTTLGITGWAIVEGGVEAYYWSADEGKTWVLCTSNDSETGKSVAAAPKTRDLVSAQYKRYYYDGVAVNYSNEEDELLRDKHCFRDSIDGQFSGGKDTPVPSDKKGSGSMLTADLSKYKGEVVDVIFAAKPVDSDVYVPVGRIDNVAVYGAKGTFYTHINSVHLGGILDYSEESEYGRPAGGTLVEPDYFDVEGKPLNHVTSGGTAAPQWDLGYSATEGKEFSYTIYEPNNVNAFNSRFYNNELNEIPSGGQVSIDGYTANLGGTISIDKSYKYTLDGGETWSVIYKKRVSKSLLDEEIKCATYSDNSIDNKDGKNRYSVGGDTSRYDSCLVFNIPALPDGAIRDLLVVVEDGDGDVMPVLHIKLKIKGNNVGLFTYDDLYAYRSNFECFESASSISVPFKREDFKDTMRFTFPVEREGVHTLTFNADIEHASSAVKVSSTADIHQAYENVDHIVGNNADVWMSVPKTHFYENEDINLTYYAKYTGKHSSGQNLDGVLKNAVICVVRLNDDGSVYKYGGLWARMERAHVLFRGNDGVAYGATNIVAQNTVNLREALTNTGINNNEPGEKPDLTDGKYRIYFLNDIDLGIGNIIHGDYSYLQLTDPIDITIHDPCGASAKIFHDDVEKGGELYYAKQGLYSSNDSRFDKAAQWSTQNVYASNDVELYFNATKEDVKRGYIILDWDLTKLAKDKEYVLNINNLMYCYGVKSTKHLTTDSNGNATYNGNDTYKIRVPALEAGTHKFAFSSYTTVYSPIIHKGINQTVVAGHSDRRYGGNYLAEGAYMSVAKTVYTVGEPIHIDYNSAGAGTGSKSDPLNSPWIGITTAINGRDVIVGRLFVGKNTVGSLTFNSGMNGCVDITESLKHLPAGDYKIYFRDDAALIYGDNDSIQGKPDNMGEYWPQMNITDPIAITIIDPNKSNEKPYKQTYYFDEVRYDWTGGKNFDSGVSGWISLDKTVFRVGEDITFDYNKSEAFGNAVDNRHLYLGFAPPNFTGDTFITPEDDNICFGNFADKVIDIPDNIAPGRYQLYCCDYGFAQARQNGSVIAVIDIVILPEDGEDPPVMDLTHIHGDESVAYGTSVPAYEYSRNSISVNITDADVTRGFVEFEYKLKNLVENADIVYSTEMFYDRQPEEDPYLINGDYIIFGEYPQSLKSPTVTILTDVVPDSRGYYMGDDGNYYAKVVSTPYAGNYTFADGSTPIVNGEEYYFKVEPIKWRILSGDQNSEYLDVLCESIIVNRPYDGDSNKYAHSDVREWLNDEFYKTAFTEIQKQYIIKKEVDNSLASTGYTANSYVSDNTNDKIYLPSYATVTNTEYGFMNANNVVDPNRAKAVTDYARAKGVWTNMSEADGNIGNGIWMLRSPADSASNFIREGYFNGEITDGGISINVNAHGVVPMLRLSIVDESSRIVTKDIFKEVGNTTTYIANYSALLNNVEQNPAVNYNYREYGYKGSYLSVPKTYFNVDESIPVSCRYNGLSHYSGTAYVCIATTGNHGTDKDTYIRYYKVTKDQEYAGTNALDMRDATVASGISPDLSKLPAGEYKIWFIYGDLLDGRWWDYNDIKGGYNNPYKNGNAITDPISIKIVDPNAPDYDYSLEYKAWIGTGENGTLTPMYSYIRLEKNVFNQGEPIRMQFKGRTEYMTAFLVDENNNLLSDTPDTRTYAASKINPEKPPQMIATWSDFYEMNNSKSLAPGKYKLYYAVEDSFDEVYKTHGAIVTIMDITILPTTEEAPTAKLDVVYTNTDGIIVKKTINDSVMLNALLNSHTGNYDLTDDNNKIEGMIELTDVQPNSTVQFIFSYDRYEIESDDIECKVDEVVSNLPIRKGALKVPGYKFATSTYNNVYIYTPQTYYVEGDTITVTFNTANVSNPRILLTTDTIGTVGQYGDIWVRETAVSRTEYGTVDISNKQYDKSSTVSLGWIESNTKWNVDDLPPGEYKIWLFDTEKAIAGTTCEMYKANSDNTYLVTEPISIKILPKDEEDIDLSMTHYSDWNYKGTNYGDAQRTNWTALTIDKTVFEEGEKIYFSIDGSWEHKWIAVIKADQFTTGTVIESHPDKEKYMRYVEYGHADRFDPNKNYLETEGLDPGQYKIIYVFGETFESAWSYATANYQNHSPTPQKIVTIMDITILPSD